MSKTHAALVVAMAVGCGGTTIVDGGGGSGGAPTTGPTTGAGASTGSTSGGGGQGGDPEWAAFCAAATESPAPNCASDAARCEASASCEENLLHGPGSALFDCIVQSGCDTCLIDVYVTDDLSPTGTAFLEACFDGVSNGCAIFEDLCIAGALFEDAHLEEMLACYDLPSCAEIEACVIDLYGPCVGWAYAYEF